MVKDKVRFSDHWTIVLGGSSGFGLATIEKLVRHGMNIAVLYRETAGNERILKDKFSRLSKTFQVHVAPFNINALDANGRETFIQQFKTIKGEHQQVKLLLHSIARGNLKPLDPALGLREDGSLSIDDIQLTTYAMATSLLDWTRLLLEKRLFDGDARVIGLTSEGSHKYWPGYAAVSIAKSSLESLMTYMAVEYRGHGIKTNLIHAGITETPSLKKIPLSDQLLESTMIRNPSGRLTKPEDVANVIYLLCTPEAFWINGSIIHVDGGEHCR